MEAGRAFGGFALNLLLCQTALLSVAAVYAIAVTRFTATRLSWALHVSLLVAGFGFPLLPLASLASAMGPALGPGLARAAGSGTDSEGPTPAQPDATGPVYLTSAPTRADILGSAALCASILGLVRAGDVELALSVPVFEEYRQVLLRPRTPTETGRSRDEMESVLDFLALAGVPTPIRYLWRPNLPHAADDMFVELAVASGSDCLVTRNSRHDAAGVLDLGIRIVDPPRFLRQWRTNHG
jgi:hypothetical protein